MFGYMILISAGFFGLLVGLLGVRIRLAPLIVSGLLVLGYLITVAATGIWAAQCWNCGVGTQDDRGLVFVATFFFYGIVTFVTLATMWASTRLATLTQKRLRRLPPT